MGVATRHRRLQKPRFLQPATQLMAEISAARRLFSK
jgi:hypothetical protein